MADPQRWGNSHRGQSYVAYNDAAPNPFAYDVVYGRQSYQHHAISAGSSSDYLRNTKSMSITMKPQTATRSRFMGLQQVRASLGAGGSAQAYLDGSGSSGVGLSAYYIMNASGGTHQYIVPGTEPNTGAIGSFFAYATSPAVAASMSVAICSNADWSQQNLVAKLNGASGVAVCPSDTKHSVSFFAFPVPQPNTVPLCITASDYNVLAGTPTSLTVYVFEKQPVQQVSVALGSKSALGNYINTAYNAVVMSPTIHMLSPCSTGDVPVTYALPPGAYPLWKLQGNCLSKATPLRFMIYKMAAGSYQTIINNGAVATNPVLQYGDIVQMQSVGDNFILYTRTSDKKAVLAPSTQWVPCRSKGWACVDGAAQPNFLLMSSVGKALGSPVLSGDVLNMQLIDNNTGAVTGNYLSFTASGDGETSSDPTAAGAQIQWVTNV